MSRAKNKRHRSRSAERRYRKQKLIDQTEQKMIHGVISDYWGAAMKSGYQNSYDFLAKNLSNDQTGACTTSVVPQRLYMSEQEWEDIQRDPEFSPYVQVKE